MANSSFIDEAIEQIDMPYSSNALPNEANSVVTILPGNQLASASVSSPEDNDRTVHPSDIEYGVELVHAMKINKKTGKKKKKSSS